MRCSIIALVRYLTVAFCACAMLADSPVRAAEREVDLELVLAADISESMDLEEAALQRHGIARAIRNPEVIEAIRSGVLGRIAIAYMEWAGHRYQTMVVNWTEVSDEKSANAFARAVERASAGLARWTSISTAITFATGSFEENGFQAPRRIIDVSGDGPNNSGEYVVDARNRAVAQGIVINGLPIVNDRPNPYGFSCVAQSRSLLRGLRHRRSRLVYCRCRRVQGFCPVLSAERWSWRSRAMCPGIPCSTSPRTGCARPAMRARSSFPAGCSSLSEARASLRAAY